MAYMAQGMPPEQAMMMAGGGMPPMGPPMGGPPMLPPSGAPMGGPPMGMDPMMGMPQQDPMEMLMGAVMGKWSQDEAQLSGEQGALMETLMMILNAQPPQPQEMFAEGDPNNAGMMPMDDTMPSGGGSLPAVGY